MADVEVPEGGEAGWGGVARGAGHTQIRYLLNICSSVLARQAEWGSNIELIHTRIRKHFCVS